MPVEFDEGEIELDRGEPGVEGLGGDERDIFKDCVGLHGRSEDAAELREGGELGDPLLRGQEEVIGAEDAAELPRKDGEDDFFVGADALSRRGAGKKHAVKEAVVGKGEKSEHLVPGKHVIELRIKEAAQTGRHILEGEEHGGPLLRDGAHHALSYVAAVIIEKIEELAAPVHEPAGKPPVLIERIDKHFLELEVAGDNIQNRVDAGRYFEIRVGYLNDLAKNVSEIHGVLWLFRKAPYILRRISPTKSSVSCICPPSASSPRGYGRRRGRAPRRPAWRQPCSRQT